MREQLQLAQATPHSTSCMCGAELEHARQRLVALWDHLAAIDSRSYEQGDRAGAERFRELVEQALAQIAAFAGELMLQSDAKLDEERSRSEVEAARAAASLSDASFMATTEINAKRADLARASQLTSTLQALAACGSALRRGRKVLVSLDIELARALRGGPSIDGTTRLTESLEVRKQYSLLRRATEADRTPDSAQLRMRLKAVELRISLLRGRDIYDKLRLDDRLELHVLQQRLNTWIENASKGTGELVEGMRLWQDAVGFTQLLHQVNLRQELREHDAAIVLGANARLEAEGETALNDDALWNGLKALLGLNDRLDDLLRRNDRCVSECRALLRMLAASLDPRSSPPSSGDVQDPYCL